MSQAEIDADTLKIAIAEIEALEVEKREIAERIAEIYARTKGDGFDVKTIKEIVALRANALKRELQQTLTHYLAALGMLADTPLGDLAAKAASPRSRADA